MIRGTRRGAALALGSVLACLAAVAQADEIVVKGDVLKGTIKEVTATGLIFETVYGKGTLEIEHKDIERLETENPFVVLHGDDDEHTGRLIGIGESGLQVDDESGETVTVPLDTIVLARARTDDGFNVEEMRSRFRYWHGNFDLAFSLTQSTVDSSALAIALLAERKKGPNRFVATGRFRYGTQKQRHEERETIENELYGKALYERDLTERLFYFASVDGEYDEIERLSIRTIPRTGLGYYLYKTKDAHFSVTAGPAYVYEKYFDGSHDDYVSASLGADARFPLPYGGEFFANAEYTPALDDWANNYLLRGEAGVLFPMTEWLAFKASVLDVYDSQPAEDTERNTLTTLVGLSLAY
jgi:putative salt-induced outer membrane protein YdiY